jgi:hypothetical protein
MLIGNISGNNRLQQIYTKQFVATVERVEPEIPAFLASALNGSE